MLVRFTLLCIVTFIVGYFLTWQLYRLKHKKFRGSSVQTKIHFWIPIFLVVQVIVIGPKALTAIVLLALLLMILREYVHRSAALSKSPRALTHLVLLLLGMFILVGISFHNVKLFTAIWYLTLMSDVVAYFFGNLVGKHPLPKVLNQKKSWEGVLGQLIGAFIGYIAFSLFVAPLPFWLWIVIGFGAAAGDLSNSFIKRQGHFKDWSYAIPGHGGYIDRLCSLSYAAILTLLVICWRSHT